MAPLVTCRPFCTQFMAVSLLFELLKTVEEKQPLNYCQPLFPEVLGPGSQPGQPWRCLGQGEGSEETEDRLTSEPKR